MLTTMVHGPKVGVMYNFCMSAYQKELEANKKLTGRQITSKLLEFRHSLRTGTLTELQEWYQLMKEL